MHRLCFFSKLSGCVLLELNFSRHTVVAGMVVSYGP